MGGLTDEEEGRGGCGGGDCGMDFGDGDGVVTREWELGGVKVPRYLD